MQKILIARIPDDWKAYRLWEWEATLLQPDGSNALRRVQMAQCRRGDTVYEEKHDMGPADDFKNREPLMIEAQHLTAMGKVKEIAERERDEKIFAEKQGLEIPDLVSLYRQNVEETWEEAHHRSVFGPGVVRVRS